MPGTVITIGTFDGVHAGHAALIRRARAAADAAGPATRVVALAFDPHPAAALRPREVPARLSTFDQRREWLAALGADDIHRLEPAPDLLGLTPDEFIDRLVAQHRPAAVVEGVDFRFGRGRAGDAATLHALGERRGFAVHIVEPVSVALLDQTVVTASSTIARWLVSRGRVGDAAIVLGRPYELTGRVVPGERRGRALGFPTANLLTPCLLPADGIYAARALAENGLSLPAAVSVGTKPTFDGAERTVEAHLLRAETPRCGSPPWSPLPGLPEYGWGLRLWLDSWLRDQMRFDSVSALVDQMERDCDRAEALARHSVAATTPRAWDTAGGPSLSAITSRGTG